MSALSEQKVVGICHCSSILSAGIGDMPRQHLQLFKLAGFMWSCGDYADIGISLTLPDMPVTCSALAVLASSSGVSSERQIFMELVKTEIGRLNKQLTSKGSVSLVFHAGGVQVSKQNDAQYAWTGRTACAAQPAHACYVCQPLIQLLGVHRASTLHQASQC